MIMQWVFQVLLQYETSPYVPGGVMPPPNDTGVRSQLVSLERLEAS